MPLRTRARSQRAIGIGIEHADQRLHSVVHIKQLLVGEKAQPFGWSNRVRLDHELRLVPGARTR